MNHQPASDKGAMTEAAFNDAYVRHRHMVFNACLRILNNVQAAEDATQATFLVLHNKQTMLNDPGALGGWLHGVAVLSARAQRRAETRRMQHENKSITPTNADDAHWNALRETLDAEIERLPASEREALVLVHLEGLSFEQAAAALKVKLGTVASRASRGLQRLRRRFGLNVNEESLGALLVMHGSDAALPDTMSQVFSVKTVSGKAAVDVSKEVLRQMVIKKIKIAGGMVAALLLAVASAAYVTHSEDKPAPVAPPVPKVAIAPDDDGWSPAVNGLQAKLRLDRRALAPGKRLEAEVLFRNTSDKLLVLKLSDQPLLGWDITNATSESVAVEESKNVKPLNSIVDGRIKVQPGQTLFWLARDLHPYFDFVADGDYTVHFTYELKDAGFWNGKVTATTTLKVDPNATNLVVKPRSRDVPIIAVAPQILIKSMSGDSSAYEGQAAYLLRGGVATGRLRISHETKDDGWVLTPIAPLTSNDVKVGDSVRINEEGYRWLRSFEPQSPGKEMNGIKAVISASKNTIASKDKWKIDGKILNSSAQVINVTGVRNILNIQYKDAPSPDITRCIGSGDSFPPHIHKLKPAGADSLIEINGAGNTINGIIGNSMLGVEFKPGVYEFSIVFRLSSEEACRQRLENVWMGSVESEPIRIKISENIDDF